MIYNMDCLDYLKNCDKNQYDLIFMDPPDNIGAKYEGSSDKVPDEQYYDKIYSVLSSAIFVAPCVWISYYWVHDVRIKSDIYRILCENPNVSAKTFIWRFTFGQYKKSDCASGFRFLVRLSRDYTWFNTGAIREESERQRLGDKRADPLGRVPDDFWCFDIPRVTGNSTERRPWHPTQHPELLMERIINMCTVDGGKVLDCYGGTGTTLRVAKRLGRHCDVCEISLSYCERISRENAEQVHV